MVIKLCLTFVYRWLSLSKKKSQTKDLPTHYQSVVLAWPFLAFLLDFYFKKILYLCMCFPDRLIRRDYKAGVYCFLKSKSGWLNSSYGSHWVGQREVSCAILPHLVLPDISPVCFLWVLFW